MMTRRRNHHAMLSVSLLHSRMSHMPSKGRTGVGRAHRVEPDREGEAERAAVAGGALDPEPAAVELDELP
jgi:hypothetical protein